MAFGSIGKVFGSIATISAVTKVNPSIFTPKLTTSLIPTSNNSLSALLAGAVKNATANAGTITPAQAAALLSQLGKK